MPPHKRARGEFAAAEATPGCPLTADLLLEIVARSDAATLLRCAATCKQLRREIRRPAFIRRVCNDGAVPARLLGFLGLGHDLEFSPPPSFSLASPATHAAASLSETHLATSLHRRCAGADRLVGYEALSSRDGLVLLRRTWWTGRKLTKMMMCVYDPMTGKGTFFPGPPDATTRGLDFWDGSEYEKYVLLTPADGVAGSCSSFLILAADFSGLQDDSRAVTVRTFSPSDSDDGGAWSPVTFASHSHEPWHAAREPSDSVAVLRGGLIHCLITEGFQKQSYIFTYNVVTAAAGWIELPAEVPASCRGLRKLHLTSSPCGRRLSLLVADKFEVSVWMLLSGGACCWARHAVIDTERTNTELKWDYPPWPTGVDIVGSGARSGAVILLPRSMDTWFWLKFDEDALEGVIVLDLETKEMHVVSKKEHAFVYEIDMASRQSAMKNF